MSLPVSLGAIRLAAQQRAGMEASQFLTTSEWNGLINAGLREVYAAVTGAYSDFYAATTTVTTTSGGYGSLPFNFARLLGVDAQLNGVTSSLRKFTFRDRNLFAGYPYTARPFGPPAMYRLIGQQIQIMPIPITGTVITLWYTPTITQLVNDPDTFDSVEGWAEFATWFAVAAALAKEESDNSFAMQMKNDIMQRCMSDAGQRDAAEPERVTDVTRDNGWDSW